MKLNEPVPVRRRIGPLRAVDIEGDAVLGEDFSGAGELEISVNDGAWAAALGSIVEMSDGYYYYQATALDVSVAGFVSIKLSGVCQDFTFRQDIEAKPQGIMVGTVDAEQLHVGPLRAADDDGNAVLGEDFSGLGELEVSVNGSDWAAAAGSIVELPAEGYYDYIPDATEVAEVGWVAVKIGGVCQEFVFRADIVEFATDAIEPVVTIISPTPDTAPGDPGGFPRTYRAAKNTPIVIEVTDVEPGVAYLVVTARFYNDSESGQPAEEVVYRRSGFRGLYVGSSFAEDITNGVRLTTKRDGGWPSRSSGNAVAHIRFAVDVVDADGNVEA